MVRNNKARKAKYKVLTELVVNTTSEMIIVKSPALLAIFQSDKLINAFMNEPDREFTVREICDSLNGDIPVQECTIRRVLSDNRVFFDTSKAVDIQKKNGVKRVVVVNVAKFKVDTAGPAFNFVIQKRKAEEEKK